MNNPAEFDLIIVGASGMGREVYALCRSLPQCGREWTVRGFLDTRPNLLDGLGDYPPILGSPFDHSIQPHERFVCAVGDASRLAIAEYLCAKGAPFIRLVDPLAKIGMNAVVGDGCILYDGAGIGPDGSIGKFVFMNSYAAAGHDTQIGEGSTIGPHVCIGGGCRIGRGVYIGTHATILPHAVIEDYAHVGPGSVVLKRVKAYTKVFGNPAVPFGKVDPDASWLARQLEGNRDTR